MSSMSLSTARQASEKAPHPTTSLRKQHGAPTDGRMLFIWWRDFSRAHRLLIALTSLNVRGLSAVRLRLSRVKDFHMTITGPVKIGFALALFALWTFATWWFEGRIQTFSRPDAVFDRLVYTVVANIIIGVAAATALLRFLTRGSAHGRLMSGFASWQRTAVWAPLGFAIGLGLYFAQGAPSSEPIVLLNAYSQVFVVSTAEVVVCWSLVAATVALRIDASKRIAIPLAAVVASLLFGAYHFAHSAPFNTIGMVGFLSAIGLLTSIVFFLSHDVYATILFHNFLGTFGVVQALAAQDNLSAFQTVQAPLVGTAIVALLVLIAADTLIIRLRAS